MEAKNQSRISRGNENPRNRRRTTTKQEDDEDEAQILEIEPDRISELPDSLLIHILSLLPSLNHVIRTGTLSKRWLRLWTFVPNLVFSPPANVLFPDLYLSARFVYNVHRTLVQSRVSKIEKFSVQIPYCAPLKSVVDSWVHFVTTNNVDDLSLRFINLKLGDFYILPQNLCTSSSLKVLELKNCAFAPVGLISWNSLRSLSLKCMNLSNGVLERILSGCPVLEILEVLYYYGLSRLKVTSPSLRELVLSDFQVSFDKDNHHHRDAYLTISAPNLRMLTISSCFYTWNVRLEDVKSLVVADLSFYLDIDDAVYDNVEEYEKYGDLLQELIEKLHHVKELKLGQWCIQVLSVLELKGLPSPLLSCKSLKLDLQVADDDLPGIAKILDISPYLETLLISNSLEFFVGGCLFDAHSFEGENYLQLRQTIPKGFLLHLKNVKIFGFRREHCEVELVEFLLKNAKALENMNIHLQREDVPWQSEYSVWREIGNGELNLPASSATIRFFASPENSCETMLLRV